MKILINFLFKKRIKILQSKKGFTLMEVLVAVGLIGIITAIAVPQFQDYREQTGLVAGNTSVGSMARAYQNCMVLKSFAECNDLSKINISCSACSSGSGARTEPPFCANYKATAGGKDFRMCVSVDEDNAITKTIGGNFKVCHNTCSGADCPNGAWSTPKVPTTVKRCKDATTDCQTTNVKPTGSASEVYSVTCQANTSTAAGTCDSGGNGTCS